MRLAYCNKVYPVQYQDLPLQDVDDNPRKAADILVGVEIRLLEGIVWKKNEEERKERGRSNENRQENRQFENTCFAPKAEITAQNSYIIIVCTTLGDIPYWNSRTPMIINTVLRGLWSVDMTLGDVLWYWKMRRLNSATSCA